MAYPSLSTVSTVLRTLGKQSLFLKYNQIALDKHACINFTNAGIIQTSVPLGRSVHSEQEEKPLSCQGGCGQRQDETDDV